MGLKTLLFAAYFFYCSAGALFLPLLGIIGYILHYNIGPEKQWWAVPINAYNIRYSYTLALATAVGMIIHWGKLRFGKQFFLRQEKCILLFVGIVWLSVILGDVTVGRYSIVDHPSVKITKVIIFTFMMTHVVTRIKYFNLLLTSFVIGVLILGLEAYDTPRSAFISGRLDSIGGPDFAESNFLAAYIASMLPIIAFQFIRGGWPMKILCFVSGVFAVNTIVLTRSRGALVGIFIGIVVALFFSPKKYRFVVMLGLIVAVAGGYYLTDEQYRDRISTITRSEEERDTSAQSRFDLAKISMKIIADHPQGVGAGNFYQTVGRYDERFAGKDAHNTYFRCGTELGLQGLSLFGFIIFYTFWRLRRDMKRVMKLSSGSNHDSLVLLSYALTISLVILLGCCLAASLLYVEFTWWFLCLPICLTRVIDNLEADQPAKMDKPVKKAFRSQYETA
jgi:hypothetical protein